MSVPQCYVEADDDELRLAFALAAWYLLTHVQAGHGNTCPEMWSEPWFLAGNELIVPEEFKYSCECTTANEMPPEHRCGAPDDCQLCSDIIDERRPEECVQSYMLSLARAILREYPQAARLQEPDHKTIYGGED